MRIACVLTLVLSALVSAAPWAVPNDCKPSSSGKLSACGHDFKLKAGVLKVVGGPDDGRYAKFVGNKLVLGVRKPKVGSFALCKAENLLIYKDAKGAKHVDFYFCQNPGSGLTTSPLYLTPPPGQACAPGPFFITKKGGKGKRASVLYCDVGLNLPPLYGTLSHSKRSHTAPRPAIAARSAESPELKLVVGTMFRDKAKYLKEWIEFHLMMGVERFLLYDNGSTDAPLDVLEPYIASGQVAYQTWPPTSPSLVPAPLTMHADDAAKQEAMFEKSLATCHSNNWGVHKPFACQVAASIDMLRRSSGQSEWLGFWDVDEFIYPTETSQIKDLTSFLDSDEYTHADQVVIRGSIFGSNEGDADSSNSTLVSERYLRRRALSAKGPSPFRKATQQFLKNSAVEGELAQTFQLPETSARKAIVRPEQAIWSTVHDWTPLAASADAWLSRMVELDDGRVKLNHYAYLSREEANEKARINKNPLAAFDEKQDAFYRAEIDLDIQWLAKAVAGRLNLK